MNATAATQRSSSVRPHIHVATEHCPTCDQPIPNEKAAEIQARADARSRELTDSISARLKAEFAQREAVLSAKAREEGERGATEKANARIAEIESANTVAVDNWREQLTASEQSKNDALEQLGTLKSEHQEELSRRIKETQQVAEQNLQAKLAERDQSTTASIATLRSQLADSEQQKQEATAQVEAVKASREADISARVQEAREALESDKTQALNEEKAKHAEETRKLTSKLEDLGRQLEKKTAAELGEGAEVKLFEALREEFDGDRFRRVEKGIAGADIVHEVMHNGQVCGKIIYDSKNRKLWRSDYVTKLREDQIAERADFAVLAALKFPAEQSQIHVIDAVIIANPARVVNIVKVLRRSIIRMHVLRVSNAERAQKSASVFDFIRSERFEQLFGKIDKLADKLLTLQEEEKKAHDNHWKKQGTAYRGIQKAHSEISAELDAALGISDEAV